MRRNEYVNAERGLECLAMAVSYLNEASYDLQEQTKAGRLAGALSLAIGGLSQAAENVSEWVVETARYDGSERE